MLFSSEVGLICFKLVPICTSGLTQGLLSQTCCHHEPYKNGITETKLMCDTVTWKQEVIQLMDYTLF